MAICLISSKWKFLYINSYPNINWPIRRWLWCAHCSNNYNAIQCKKKWMQNKSQSKVNPFSIFEKPKGAEIKLQNSRFEIFKRWPTNTDSFAGILKWRTGTVSFSMNFSCNKITNKPSFSFVSGFYHLCYNRYKLTKISETALNACK